MISGPATMLAREKRFDAFLSHNSKDKPVVEEIAKWLQEQRQLRVWIDSSLAPGEPWQEKLEEALDASRCCVVFVGGHGISPWQNEEMRIALSARVTDESIRVVPVLLPGAAAGTAQLPMFMGRLHWVRFRNDWNELGALDRLVAGIRGVAPSAESTPHNPAIVARGLTAYLRQRTAELEESIRVVPDARPLPLRVVYVPVRVAGERRRELRRKLDEDDPHSLWTTPREEENEDEVRSWSSVRRELIRPAILLGDPGYGKSTTIAFEFVERVREWQQRQGKLPVHMKAADLAEAKSPHEAVVEAVLSRLGTGDPALRAAVEEDVRRRLAEGEIHLLLDALDESSQRVDRALTALWTSSGRRLGILVTSRIAGFTAPDVPQLQWQVYELTAWRKQDIERFVEAHFRAEPALAAAVLERLRTNESLRNMAAVPILLALLCWLTELRGDLPRKRRELYREFLRRLLTRPRAKRSPDRVSARLQIVGDLALAFQRAGRDSMEQEWIESFVENHPRFATAFGARSAEQALIELSEEDGLLVRTSRALSAPFYFLHRTIQEFLAATALTREANWSEEARSHFWFEPRWQELIVFLGGELGDRADALLEALLEEQDDIFGSMLHLVVRTAAETPLRPSPAISRIEQRLIALHGGKGGAIRQVVLPIIQALGANGNGYEGYPRFYASLVEQFQNRKPVDGPVLPEILAMGISPSAASVVHAALFEALRDGNRARSAAQTLREIGLHDAVVLREVFALTENENKYSSIRWHAIELLAAIAPLTEEYRAVIFKEGGDALQIFADRHGVDEELKRVLVAELRHDNPYRAVSAVRILASHCSDDAAIREAVLDAYSARAGEARKFHFALAEMAPSDPRVRNILIAALSPGQASEVRDGAAFALGRLPPDAEIRDALLAALEKPDSFVRIAAAESLAVHGVWTKSVKRALIGGLEGGWNQAIWAAHAFQRAGGVDREAAEALLWWITHERDGGDVEEDDYFHAQQAAAETLRDADLDACGITALLLETMRHAHISENESYAAFALSRRSGEEAGEICDSLRKWLIADQESYWSRRIEVALRELSTRLRRNIRR